jgi:hypothetical protein
MVLAPPLERQNLYRFTPPPLPCAPLARTLRTGMGVTIMDDAEADRDLPNSLLFDLLGIVPTLTLASLGDRAVAAVRPAMGY